MKIFLGILKWIGMLVFSAVLLIVLSELCKHNVLPEECCSLFQTASSAISKVVCLILKFFKIDG